MLEVMNMSRRDRWPDEKQRDFADSTNSGLRNEWWKLNKNVKDTLDDLLLWDVPLINDKTSWPTRKKCIAVKMFRDAEDYEESQQDVNYYLGKKTSQEVDQFLTALELKTIGHKDRG